MPFVEAAAASAPAALLFALAAALALALLCFFNTAATRLPWAAPPGSQLRTMIVLGSGACSHGHRPP
jgi:hypothetical protein